MLALDQSVGALTVGTFLATFVSGIALSLGVNYWRAFPCDRLVFRALALVSLTLALTLTAINASYIWAVCITHYGDAIFMTKASWQMGCLFPFVSVSCTALQFFLAYRAWILSGRSNKWAASLIGALTLLVAALVLALYFPQSFARQGGLLYGSQEVRVLYAWWALSTSGEAIITASLIYWVIINPQYEPKGARSMGLLRRFSLRAVETNILSIAVQLVIVVLIARSAHFGMWFCTVAFSLPSLYTISLMLALLSRASEEATFKFEADKAPIVTRPRAANPNPVTTQVEVLISGEVQVDTPHADSFRWSGEGSGGYRRPKIRYSHGWGAGSEASEVEKPSA